MFYIYICGVCDQASRASKKLILLAESEVFFMCGLFHVLQITLLKRCMTRTKLVYGDCYNNFLFFEDIMFIICICECDNTILIDFR